MKQSKANGTLAFSKTLRLLNASEFKAVFDNAPYRASHKLLLILARPNGLPHPRLGLIIAKKNVRQAVQRNRIKRVARESFRLQQHKLAGIDAIVLARRDLHQLDNSQLHAVFEQQWHRIIKKARKAETQSARQQNETPPPEDQAPEQNDSIDINQPGE